MHGLGYLSLAQSRFHRQVRWFRHYALNQSSHQNFDPAYLMNRSRGRFRPSRIGHRYQDQGYPVVHLDPCPPNRCLHLCLGYYHCHRLGHTNLGSDRHHNPPEDLQLIRAVVFVSAVQFVMVAEARSILVFLMACPVPLYDPGH